MHSRSFQPASTAPCSTKLLRVLTLLVYCASGCALTPHLYSSWQQAWTQERHQVHYHSRLWAQRQQGRSSSAICCCRYRHKGLCHKQQQAAPGCWHCSSSCACGQEACCARAPRQPGHDSITGRAPNCQQGWPPSSHGDIFPPDAWHAQVKVLIISLFGTSTQSL